MSEPKSSKKGPELEEMLKAYFWHAGYFALRGVPFNLEEDDVTDVDVWLYERPAASTRRRLIVDAKNKKSPKASERIIWTRGLQTAISVDGAIVATTDSRPGSRKLAKSVGVVLLDGNALEKIRKNELLQTASQLSFDDFVAQIRAFDSSRRGTEWRDLFFRSRALLLTGIGVQSANMALHASKVFAEGCVVAPPNSPNAAIALRLFFSTCALAAISLDYVLADQLFRTVDERRQSLSSAIRFGQSDAVPALTTIRAAVNLARKYAPNGNSVAKQIESGFYAEADGIPAEIIADFLSRLTIAEGLFSVARELEKSAGAVDLPSFDQLSAEARSLLGVFLDFNQVSREKVANSWLQPKNAPFGQHSAESTGSLFSEKEN